MVRLGQNPIFNPKCCLLVSLNERITGQAIYFSTSSARLRIGQSCSIVWQRTIISMVWADNGQYLNIGSTSSLIPKSALQIGFARVLRQLPGLVMEEPDRSPPVLILRVFSSSAFTLIPGGSDGLPLRGLNRCGPKQKNGNIMKALLFLPSYI